MYHHVGSDLQHSGSHSLCSVVVTSVDDAVQNLVCGLSITEEKAKAIVAKVAADNNGKPNKEELVKLWEAIRAK